jgi:hypothetical protein
MTAASQLCVSRAIALTLYKKLIVSYKDSKHSSTSTSTTTMTMTMQQQQQRRQRRRQQRHRSRRLHARQ